MVSGGSRTRCKTSIRFSSVCDRVTISFILTFSLTDFTLTISQTDHTSKKASLDIPLSLC